MPDRQFKIGDLVYDKDGNVVGEVLIVNRRQYSLWDYRIQTPAGTVIDLKGLESDLEEI